MFSKVIFIGIPATPPTPGFFSAIWYSASDNVHELSGIDFSLIKTAPSPSPDNSSSRQTYGIGGSEKFVWCIVDQSGTIICQLDFRDLSAFRATKLGIPQGAFRDIGGDENVIWYCTSDGKILELDTDDFSQIRSLNSPMTIPRGIGGTSSKIWSTGEDFGVDEIYELATFDFSIIRSSNSTPESRGIGGDSNVIIYVDNDSGGNVLELSTVDFSIVRSEVAPSSEPKGIGGSSTFDAPVPPTPDPPPEAITDEVVWYIGLVIGAFGGPPRIRELSVIDLSTIRASGAVRFGTIGGNSNIIWRAFQDNTEGSAAILEISTIDFSIIRSEIPPTIDVGGIGGDTDVIWYRDGELDFIYQLDPIDFSIVKFNDDPSPFAFSRDIGGSGEVIWGDADQTIQELSNIDFSIIRSAVAPPLSIIGVGGSKDNIWVTTINNFQRNTYKLSPVDFSILLATLAPDNNPLGMGGA